MIRFSASAPTRSLLRALVGVALVATLGGCQSMGWSSGGDAPRSSRLDQILDSQTLRVGMTGNQPPLNMVTATGDPIGLEVDLINALAGSMGLAVERVEMPFAELLPALMDGRVDIVISGVTITPERNARVAFAGPYFITGKSLLTKDAEISAARSPTPLNDPGRSFAALSGSTSQDFVEQHLPEANLVAVDDYDAGVEMVMNGKVDALIADYHTCEISVLRHPDAGLSTLVTPYTIEPLGIALPANAPLFVNLVENYLTTLENTGMLTRLKAKWLSAGSWVHELR